MQAFPRGISPAGRSTALLGRRAGGRVTLQRHRRRSQQPFAGLLERRTRRQRARRAHRGAQRRAKRHWRRNTRCSGRRVSLTQKRTRTAPPSRSSGSAPSSSLSLSFPLAPDERGTTAGAAITVSFSDSCLYGSRCCRCRSRRRHRSRRGGGECRRGCGSGSASGTWRCERLGQSLSHLHYPQAATCVLALDHL